MRQPTRRPPPHPWRPLSGSWRDGTPTSVLGTLRRSKLQMHPRGPPPPLAPPPYPSMWNGTGSGQRSPEHRNGCLCRSGHLPVNPLAFLQPMWTREDINFAKGNILLWGLGGVEEGSLPAPRLLASPRGVTYASVTPSAARGSRAGAVRVVAAAGRAKVAPPPNQPMVAALWALLPWTTSVQPHRLC